MHSHTARFFFLIAILYVLLVLLMDMSLAVILPTLSSNFVAQLLEAPDDFTRYALAHDISYRLYFLLAVIHLPIFLLALSLSIKQYRTVAKQH